MKAIILAAGSGNRLKKYTTDLPKGMLSVFGKPIIQHQIENYRRNGVTDITIVKGFCGEKIDLQDVKTFTNPLYATTNMLESLFCASSELVGDVIISYADILFEDHVLQSAIECTHDVGVLVDSDWKDYWQARYGRVDFDTESLSFNGNGTIKELGTASPPLNTIDGRYVGMIRLSAKGCSLFSETYYHAKQTFAGKPWLNQRNFENVYMTDFLQELINNQQPVYPIIVQRGWVEFDTNEDYEQVMEWSNSGSLARFYTNSEINY